MSMIYDFSTKDEPELKTVGGKGMSLILTSRQGFPVPPGFVLTTNFFIPWFDELKKSPLWNAAINSLPEECKNNCDKLKGLCNDLVLNPEQNKLLDKAMDNLLEKQASLLVAVRSSSPEEDLEGASFAGGYETTLGVTRDSLLTAIKDSFASCLDERVFVYKKEQGFNITSPNIAVIIQAQVASESAGVAFSLNPLNNCYDEAVINANFGLGETVVSGQISPDQFVVDKIERKILEKKLGKKEHSLLLLGNGGTKEETNSEGYSLTEEQVLKLTDLVVRVEEYYGKPMDIEWAFAGAKLYLLQARPVTAFFKLPEEMQTDPGEARLLYIDMLLSKQGIQEAFSTMGIDVLEYTQRAMFTPMMGSEGVIHLKEGFAGNAGGRSYVNISNTMKMQGKDSYIKGVKTQDSLASEILQNLDKKEYIPKKTPKRLKGILVKMIFNNIGLLKKALKAFKKPDEFHLLFEEKTKELVHDLEKEKEKKLGVKEFAENVSDIVVDYFMNFSLSVTLAAEIARSKMKKLFKTEEKPVQDKIVKLEQALPNNVTIEMGLAMFRLACRREIKECADGKTFEENLSSGKFPGEFIEEWNNFMKGYGHRCPKELDIATPRFYENPGHFFEQLKVMADLDAQEQNPQIIFDNGVIQRKQTFEELREIISKKGKGKVKKFVKYYKVLETFGAYREIHKYYWILVLDMIRQRIRQTAASLVDAGRLENIDQAFDLKLEDLDKGITDPAFDLITIAAKNAYALKDVKNFANFPRLIDSRGKILRGPQKEVKEGEIGGEPISPGTIRGKVKVLHSPDEKPLLPGEILVARATDPGWTPLFINAGGIILEVGGLLQHGALVAREYCKPCVAGIENVTELLKDGQEVELDGSGGIIKVIDGLV